MDWFFVVARAVQFAASIALFGVFVFECLIVGSALAATAAALALTARLRNRLDALAWTSLLLVVISGAAWLLAVAANMSGQPLAVALGEGVWQTVLTRTQFGADWLARIAVAGLVAICLPLRRGGDSVAARLACWAGLLFAGALLAALAWAGHGASTPGTPGELHLAADIVHLLAAGVWIGMLVPLALLLVALRGAGGALAIAAAAAAARRFSLLAAVSVMALLAGGIVNTWFLAGSVAALLGTPYGHLLLAKIGLFLATLVIASVNLLRLAPRLDASATRSEAPAWRAATWLRRNALAEAGLGLFVVAIVGALGLLPPGTHSEPGWPLPVRIDLAALAPAMQALLAVLFVIAAGGAVALVALAAAAQYRVATLLAAAGVLLLGGIALLLKPALEPAYPTSFYTPAEPYAAPSIVAGGALYAANCALCHGADGEGNGPAAATLSVRPANLTEAHLFAHTPGDLFWWVSNGRDNGVMPGFARVMTPGQRWDVINFVRARAAGAMARGIGTTVARAAAPAFPDFAFERGMRQDTLRQALRDGPVLLALFAAPTLPAHVGMLLRLRLALAAAELQIIAVDVMAPAVAAGGVARVAPEILSALALFRSPDDGGETDFLLDRNGDIRARFTATGNPGLPDAATLIADARIAAAVPIAAPSHAGHAE